MRQASLWRTSFSALPAEAPTLRHSCLLAPSRGRAARPERATPRTRRPATASPRRPAVTSPARRPESVRVLREVVSPFALMVRCGCAWLRKVRAGGPAPAGVCHRSAGLSFLRSLMCPLTWLGLFGSGFGELLENSSKHVGGKLGYLAAV